MGKYGKYVAAGAVAVIAVMFYNRVVAPRLGLPTA